MRAAVQMLALSTLVVAGCSTNAQEVSQQATVSVKTMVVEQGVIGTGKVYTGTITPLQKVDIAPKVSGKIESLMVDVGTPVKKGQVLFKLEDKDLRHTVEKADAAVAAAEASIETARTAQQSGVVQANSGVVQSKSGMVQAQGAITQAQSALEQAQNSVVDADNVLKKAKQGLTDATSQFNRMKMLYESGAASKAQLEQAETAYVSAQTGYNSAEVARKGAAERLSAAKKSLATAQTAYENTKAGYSNAQRQVGVASSTAGVRASEQAAQQARVTANIARDALNDATVVSPIDGIVAVKNGEIGQMTSPQSPVLVVTNLSTVNVLFYVSGQDVGDLQPGTKMMVKVNSLKLTAEGTVKSVSPMDEKGKGYPVQVSIPNPGLKLKAGLVAELTPVVAGAKQGLVVPASAVLKEQNKAYVFVANGDRAKRKEVQIGEEKSGTTLVTGGLGAGETVIVNNVAVLSDNAKINVQKP